jgi:hypothetical protein
MKEVEFALKDMKTETAQGQMGSQWYFIRSFGGL